MLSYLTNPGISDYKVELAEVGRIRSWTKSNHDKWLQQRKECYFSTYLVKIQISSYLCKR